MPSVWLTSGVFNDNLIRVGPFADAVCGTDVGQTDLNAVVAAGNSRIILAPGAVLTANLVLSASSGFIWSPFAPRALNLGAYGIYVTGSFWSFQGFALDGGTGVGLEIAGSSQGCHIERLSIRNQTSHGLQLNTSGNDHVVLASEFNLNGGSGIKVESGSSAARIFGCMCYANTGWGIFDNSGAIIEGGNRLDANTAGARSTSSTSIDGKSKTS